MTETSRLILQRRDREVEQIRLQAIWNARKTFYFAAWHAEPAILGGYRPSVAEQMRQLRLSK
jgi:hypothetical protein